MRASWILRSILREGTYVPRGQGSSYWLQYGGIPPLLGAVSTAGGLGMVYGGRKLLHDPNVNVSRFRRMSIWHRGGDADAALAQKQTNQTIGSVLKSATGILPCTTTHVKQYPDVL